VPLEAYYLLDYYSKTQFGPHWLLQPSATWPQESQLTLDKENLEERTNQVFVTTTQSNLSWDLIHKYSHSTSAHYRFMHKSYIAIPKISKCDINHSYHYKKTRHSKTLLGQECSIFQQELRILAQGNPLPRFNHLLRLTPFLDFESLFRIRGRLQFSLLPENAKHPLILPRDSLLTSLTIVDAHQYIAWRHANLSVIYSKQLLDHWRPSINPILKCVCCARYRQKRAQQIMGQLPPERLNPSRPFLHSGRLCQSISSKKLERKELSHI